MTTSELKRPNGLIRTINKLGILVLRPLIVVGLAGVLAVLHLPRPTEVWESSRSRFRDWVQQMG